MFCSRPCYVIGQLNTSTMSSIPAKYSQSLFWAFYLDKVLSSSTLTCSLSFPVFVSIMIFSIIHDERIPPKSHHTSPCSYVALQRTRECYISLSEPFVECIFALTFSIVVQAMGANCITDSFCCIVLIHQSANLWWALNAYGVPFDQARVRNYVHVLARLVKSNSMNRGDEHENASMRHFLTAWPQNWHSRYLDGFMTSINELISVIKNLNAWRWRILVSSQAAPNIKRTMSNRRK